MLFEGQRATLQAAKSDAAPKIPHGTSVAQKETFGELRGFVHDDHSRSKNAKSIGSDCYANNSRLWRRRTFYARDKMSRLSETIGYLFSSERETVAVRYLRGAP